MSETAVFFAGSEERLFLAIAREAEGFAKSGYGLPGLQNRIGEEKLPPGHESEKPNQGV